MPARRPASLHGSLHHPILAEKPLPGKAGKNVKAIRFIRIMAKLLCQLYDTPLNNVLMAAANSIFETQYSESDIRKLLSR